MVNFISFWILMSPFSLIILEFVTNDRVGVLENLEAEEIFLYFEGGKLISLDNLGSRILTSPLLPMIGLELLKTWSGRNIWGKLIYWFLNINISFVANDRVGVLEYLKWKKYLR